MMMDLFSFSGVLLILLYLAAGVFILLWPLLIWSHLREHTKYLAEIRDILKAQQKN